MGQFHDAPERYLNLMRASLPGYDRLQDAIARAGADLPARRILDLGAGTGETARRCAALHLDAALVATDASPEMLELARAALGPSADLRPARLEDPLPAGPFDLIVSALAVHHLDGAGKAGLFRRIAPALAPGGRFVLGDVLIADGPVAHPSPLDPAVDRPDRLSDLLRRLRAAGLRPKVSWAEDDLVVIACALDCAVRIGPVRPATR